MRHRHRLSVPLAILLAGACAASSAAQQNPDALGASLLQNAAIKTALERARANEADLVKTQIALCEIPAPPFKESVRAEAYKQRFQALGLKNVRIDKIGNVIGERPGKAARPNLVFAAHLDTVFPEGTDVKVKANGTTLAGPGISDDCRGLAVVLGVIKALDEAKVETPGTITFVGNVGEEGLGDLRGVKHLFNEELKGKIDRFVSVDGTGAPDVTNQAVGSYRYRITFKGPGGHSYGAFGIANPIHALGRAIDGIADIQVPTTPKATFNVGRVGGGTSVNSIAFEAWMEVDMRSPDPGELKKVQTQVLAAVDKALADENARWKDRGKISVEKTLVGDRPAGSTPADSPIVKAALSVAKALGATAELHASSTDSNYPMSLGIPAITIPGGGDGAHAHSLEETFDTTDSYKGTQWALLIAVALAQP